MRRAVVWMVFVRESYEAELCVESRSKSRWEVGGWWV